MGRLREPTEDVHGSIRRGRRPLLQGPAAADLGSTQWWAILHSRVSPYRPQLLQRAVPYGARFWQDARVVSAQDWEAARRRLHFGQRFLGTVVRVPSPGAIGIFVDIGLPVNGFVDVLLLPSEAERWPAEGTESEFEVWWADERLQVRLKPADPRFVREDFAEWLTRWRPGWPQEHGLPVTVADVPPSASDAASGDAHG